MANGKEPRPWRRRFYHQTVGQEQWIQLAMLSIAPLATLAVVLVGFLYNNARLTDLRNDLTSRMNALETNFQKRLEDTRELLRAEISRNHSEMLHRFGDLDRRLTRIETGLNLR